MAVAWIDSRSVPVADAADKAAELLSASFYPVFSLDTDVHGTRAAIELARLVGAAYDQLDGAATAREAAQVTDKGGMFIAPGEVRRRADMLVIVGALPVAHRDLIAELATTVPDLGGAGERHIFLIGAEARTAFWPFLRAKFGYTDEQIRPYTYNMAPFLADKKLSQQGFLSSEPFAIRKAGVNPVVHLLADNGFDAYNTTINVSRKLMDAKKDLVQRFVTATLEGWDQYMKAGPEAAAANALILKDNPDMDQEKIDYAVKVMNENGIVRSGDALTLGIGAMTDLRWANFYKTMSDVGVFPAGVDVKKAYSLDFINQGVGKG